MSIHYQIIFEHNQSSASTHHISCFYLSELEEKHKGSIIIVVSSIAHIATQPKQYAFSKSSLPAYLFTVPERWRFSSFVSQPTPLCLALPLTLSHQALTLQGDGRDGAANSR